MTGADVLLRLRGNQGILDINHLKILLRDESREKDQSCTVVHLAGKHVT